MRIGLDLDGVCYDFGRSMRDWLGTIGYCFPVNDPEQNTWDFYDEWGMSREDFNQHFINGVNAGIIFKVNGAHPGTYEGVQQIIDMGHDIHIITDRTVGYPGVSWAHTGEWIDKHLPKPIKSVTFTADKTLVPTDMMIDDRLSNYDALIQAGCDAWLFDRPWNQNPDREVKRVSSMLEFAAKVKEKRPSFV